MADGCGWSRLQGPLGKEGAVTGADSMEMAELYLRRAHYLGKSHFQPLWHYTLPGALGVPRTLK